MHTVGGEFGWIHFRYFLDSEILADVAEADALRRVHDAQRTTSTNAIAAPCLVALACSPQRHA
jgi:hypothetical protein